MKQCLDKTQVAQLIKLGVDLSNVLVSVPPLYYPTLTIGELIDRLPLIVTEDDIDYYLDITKKYVSYSINDLYGDAESIYFYARTELIDNLFEMYKHLITNKIIKI